MQVRAGEAGVRAEAGGEGQVVEPVRLPRGARSLAGGARRSLGHISRVFLVLM